MPNPIRTAANALLEAARHIERTGTSERFTGPVADFFDTMSRNIIGQADLAGIEEPPQEVCHQSGNLVDEPCLFVRTFCSEEHRDRYTTTIEDNESAMQSAMLGEDEAIRQNAVMRIALHKLLNMGLTGGASYVVADVCQELARDYGQH